MNVLIVEDSNVMRVVFKEILELFDVEINIFYAKNYLEAVEVFEKENIDVAFVDICLEDGDRGFDIIRNFFGKIKNILIVSAYEENFIKDEIKELEVKFIKKDEHLTDNIVKFIEENFKPLDDKIENDLDFFDFDAELEDNAKELMTEYNESHGKIDAKTFLDKNPDNKKLLFYSEELLNKISELNLLNEDNYEDFKELIILTLEEFLILINDPLFEELNDVISELINIVDNLDINNLNSHKKSWFVKYLSSIISDIEDWIRNVFTEQIAIDVCYINASILNAVFELKNIIGKNF